MANRLANRVAIVTGAASGMGLAIARRFTAEGARVVRVDLDGNNLAATHEAGGAWLDLAIDITDVESAVRAVAVAQEHWGRLDILVNNAGIWRPTTLEDVGTAIFDRMHRVMVEATLQFCRAAVPHLARSPSPRIVNIASVEGLRGKPGSLAYGTAKGALVNLTRELACELGERGITVNAIAPGFVDTPMNIRPDGSSEIDDPVVRDVYLGQGFIPLRRIGHVDDIAGPVLFLAGDDAAYVTGQILCVDGGLTAGF